MQLSNEQLAVVNANDKKIIVDAGSGSGKTRVLVERVKRLISTGSDPSKIVVITYTNMAAGELISRLSDVKGADRCFIGTIHSYAYKLLQKVDATFEIFTENHQTKFMKYLIEKYGYRCTFSDYEDLVKYERLAASGRMSANKIPEKFSDISVYNELMNLLGRGTVYGAKETVVTLCRDNNVLTFDDLIKHVTESGSIPKIDHLFVDEFQDVGYLEYNFLLRLNAQNYFVIGDDYQCQPFGTLVTMDDGELRAIEDIQVGDYVLSYTTSEGYYRQKTSKSRGYKVLSKQVSLADKLIHVKLSDGRVTSYTPNHRCLAKINYTEKTKDMSVVYIMMDAQGRFRVGSTRLFVTGGRNFGVRNRMNTEHGIHAWIVDVFDTAKDAWFCEQLCAYKYGIPQVTWAHQNTTFSFDDIKRLYSELGDLRDKAAACLSAFGRDINYPLFVAGTNTHFSKQHVTEVRACNLIAGVMDLAYPMSDGTSLRMFNAYATIYKTECVSGCFDVVALEIEKSGIYVADGFLTHNSIFQFDGGDVKLFLSMVNSPEWKNYILSENYRTAKSILSYATSIVKKANDIIDKPVTPMREEQGTLQFITKRTLSKQANELSSGEWFFLVRTNKEMRAMCGELKKMGLNFNCVSHGEIIDSGGDSQDKNITVMTIHSSKGLECENVALYGKFPVNGKGQSEEIKVFYVGLTRSINKCIVFI